MLATHFSQEAFMENYFSSQRDHIFRNVEVLIYVFDIESRELQVDFSLTLRKTYTTTDPAWRRSSKTQRMQKYFA